MSPFQSTPPARGATLIHSILATLKTISIHAPREGGDETETVNFWQSAISIHAPREGGDYDI